jgi:hypothetical protein
MSAHCQAVVRTGAERSPTLVTGNVKGGDPMLAQLIEIYASWIIGGAVLRWWFKSTPNDPFAWINSLWRWSTAGFFLIFGVVVLFDVPEPLFWAGLVPPILVLLLLDAHVFARWPGAQDRMKLTSEEMLFSLFEDRPKSKRKRKPKIKRKNDWGP